MDPPDQEADGKVELAIGIDLGTTYSAVACVDESGKPFSIRNQDGDLLTPTAVLIDDQDIVIGREAVNASVMEPQSFADCFKRDVGSPTYRRGVCGVQIPPQVLNAFVLEQLKNDAERRIGAVTKAVITVPAFFDESRRKATQDAGRLAGIEVLDIINEPTAAALAYGYQHGLLNLDQPNTTSTRVLVYDLGGGTFDVTILEVSGTRYRAVATDGDVQLGGKDFDERLVEFFAEAFVEEHGIDPRSDPRDAAQLWIDAQRAKHTLSQRSKTSTVVSHAGLRSNIEIRREQFEQLTRDLLERTETTTSLVLREAGHSWDEIDRILLVGGSSRMPAVTDMLQRVSGKEVDRSLSPDEAIAHGAALHAAMMTRKGHTAFADCQLINVNSHSLGVRGIDPQTRRRVNAIMIPKNTPLPCKQAKTFTTAENDQRSVKVVVLEGESRRPEDCIQLGDCVIRDLPPGLPQGSKIEVTYSYEPNGRVTVSARMPQTRQSARVAIRRSNAVELEDLESWRRRLLSQDGTTAAAVDPSDPGSVLRRLDALYSEIGLAAMDGKVPSTVTHYQSAARDARTTFKAAETAAKQVAGKKQAAISRADAVRLSTQFAKCQSKLEQSETRFLFSCVVLGRECVKHGHVPTGVADQAAEATELRRQQAV